MFSCKKYLDEKPDGVLNIPTTIEDLELLLDNYAEINGNSYPSAAEIQSDNFFWKPEFFQSQTELSRDLYTWSANSQTLNYWFNPYKQILTTNIVLETIPNLDIETDTQKRNEVKGRALFIRSMFYNSLMDLFAMPYSPETKNEPGIILRLNSDINENYSRSTIQAGYDQILSDLKESSRLLPEVSIVKSRPNKQSAYGALAKVYLSMNLFDSAGLYADKCLKIYDSLIDFNTLNVNATAPLRRFNKEVIFQMRGQSTSLLTYPNSIVDTNLYTSYSDFDLRKKAFFDKRTQGTFFKGDYDGAGIFSNGYVFSGITTNEMFLIRSECFARNNNLTDAMADLNHLLKTRWNNSIPYIDITASSQIDALVQIIAERRKELIRRGTRWVDIRRLRNDPQLRILPKRIIKEQNYDLDVNSPRLALLIPFQVINQTGIQQNP